MPQTSLFPEVPGGTHLHLTQHVPHALVHTFGLECILHLPLHSPSQSRYCISLLLVPFTICFPCSSIFASEETSVTQKIKTATRRRTRKAIDARAVVCCFCIFFSFLIVPFLVQIILFKETRLVLVFHFPEPFLGISDAPSNRGGKRLTEGEKEGERICLSS